MGTTPQDPLDWIDAKLASLHRHGLRRQRRTRSGPQAAMLPWGAPRLINFGSNDYLGLAADPQIAQAATKAIAEHGWGAGASPLITGRTTLHAQLEQALARFEGTESAILFSSGYAANVGTIAAIARAGDVIFADAKNHASLIDGCQLARADVIVYRHRDVTHLESLLKECRNARRRLIVTDSLFSMDGDFAPLAELAELRDRYGGMLMIDEAHATGIFGERGRGVAEMQGVEHAVDIKVGTLSKAIGCAGGFVAGSERLIEFLAHLARPYVFSTAHPAATAAAALRAVAMLEEQPERRQTLLANAAQLRERLLGQGWNLGDSGSQILPLRIGDPARTMAFSASLADAGLFVPGIRPPSVPHGESLLRISLSYLNDETMIDQLVESLDTLRKETMPHEVL